jgi:hypothetical protein
LIANFSPVFLWIPSFTVAKVPLRAINTLKPMKTEHVVFDSGQPAEDLLEVIYLFDPSREEEPARFAKCEADSSERFACIAAETEKKGACGWHTFSPSRS